MLKSTSILALMLGAGAFAPSASAQNILAEKPIYTLGEAKTWAAGDQSYTFVTDDLAKLVAVPTNTANVYLYPENGTLNTPENQAIGIQGFYIDMEAKQAVGTVTTTWEGAAANAYDIYLTDEVPTLAILNTTPTYSAKGLGQYTSNTAVLQGNPEGRYLVFQPTEPTNYGWGVKIRSISATAPVEAELASFTVAPAIVALGEPTQLTMTFKDQLGIAIDASKVTVTASDNATLSGNTITITSGTSATLTAKMGEKTLTAVVYVAVAPALPEASQIKTPIFTNTVTDHNATAGWVAEYNGGAKNNGLLTFANGEVAWSFGDTRCVFFYNSETTGAWNGAINPQEKGYRTLHLDIFGTKDCAGMIEFEGTDGAIEHTQNFNLTAGQWNAVDINLAGETRLANMSVRFTEDNMCDILLANIYFTPAYVEGDEEAPVLGEITAVPAMTSVALSFSATDNLSTDVYYTISDGTKSYTTSGKSGETVEYSVAGLEPNTEYTFTVTANDGKNVSEPKTVKATTTAMPNAPELTFAAEDVIAIYSPQYGKTEVPAFDAWGSKATAGTTTTADGTTVLSFNNYEGQYGGLVNLTVKVENLEEPQLHLDIFGSDKNGAITIAPVWAAATGDTPNKQITVLANQWNSFDFLLSDFGYDQYGNEIIQLAMTNSQISNFAVTNVLIHGIYTAPEETAAPWIAGGQKENYTVNEEIYLQCADPEVQKIYFTLDGSDIVIPGYGTVALPETPAAAPRRAVKADTYVKNGTNLYDGTPIVFEGEAINLNYVAYEEGKAPSAVMTLQVNADGQTTGIENVTVNDENAPVEYFNLQGIRVANPENGIFIRRQGSKTTKVIIR